MGNREIKGQLILENTCDNPHDFFNAEMEKLLPSSVDKICIAVSGGSDSLCLLWLSYNWCQSYGVKLFCVTVDHRLRPESFSEALFVREICHRWSVEHEILYWNHDNLQIEHGKLENMAREARYGLISEYCTKHNIPVVCVAHNWDDQLETYKLRKDFVSKEKFSIGLAGMSQRRSLTENLVLIRPTLHFTKQCMKDILIQQNITWKNDPMNDDESYKRVQYRKILSIYSDQEKSDITNEILKIGERRRLTESAAVPILRKNVHISDFGYAYILFSDFLQWEADIQREVLRRVLWTIGGKKYPPTITDRFLNSLIEKHTEVLWNCLVVYKKKQLMIFREHRNIEMIQWNNIRGGTIIWDNRFKIDVLTINKLLQNCPKNEARNKTNFIFPCDEVLSNRKLPREVVRTLPKIVTSGGTFILNSGIKFIKKVNLFDIFM